MERYVLLLVLVGIIYHQDLTTNQLRHQIAIRDSVNVVNRAIIDSIMNNTYDVSSVIRTKFGKSKYKEEENEKREK